MATALATIVKNEKFTNDQIDLIRRTLCKGSTDDELRLFMYQAERTGLDPLARQIYAVKRWDAQAQREVMSIQTSIDGFRLIAERSGKYAGQLGPFWCGPDGEWVDVWVKSESPAAGKVGILRTDFKEPCWGIARFESYSQKKKDGSLTRMWQAMGDVMIAKCAEALGLRKAFPQELSGLYTNDEMEQAQQEPAPKAIAPNIIEQPKSEPPHDPQTGEITDWIKFGQDSIAAVKANPDHIIDLALFDRMAKEAPKVHKRMMAAITKLRPAHPSPADDPESYLQWLRIECAKITTLEALTEFNLQEANALKAAFPPDQQAAKGIFAARARELESA